MTTQPPAPVEAPESTDRLAELVALYDVLKPKADEVNEHLKACTDAIKAELQGRHPGAPRVMLSVPGATPLQMVHSRPWHLDTKRLKAEDPHTYVKYAYQRDQFTLKKAT